MQVYIDESGNLGKDKNNFFVIAALIPTKAKRIKNIIKRACLKFGVSDNILEEIKGSQLKFEQKQDLLNKLCGKNDFSFSCIVADKNHINPKILQDKNICYNYLTSLLLKPIIKGSDEDIQFILDNHTVKVTSTNSLEDYIKIEAYSKWGFDKKMTFEYRDSKTHTNLQAVDLIANTIYGRYNYNKKHLYDILLLHLTRRIKFPYQKFGK